MKNTRLFTPFFGLLCALFSSCGHFREQCSVGVENMVCEYMESPAGLDVREPRFSWTLAAVDTAAYRQKQSAYRIVVSDTPKGNGNMWDSGWVSSERMQLIPYNGLPLVSDRTYYWKIAVRDENGVKSRWSETRSWTTGLFDASEWTAQWIGSDEIFDQTVQPDCNIWDPWLRKTVTLDKKTGRAQMFVASVGFHELYVNGERVGDHVLAPAVSDHSRRARYIAYDIAPYLREGDNVIGLWLGAGWSIYEAYETDDKPRTPMVLAQADVFYKGQAEPSVRIATDGTWKTHPSPNKLLGHWGMRSMGGELWDAGREIPDWNLLSYDDSGWKQAAVYFPDLIVSAQNTYPNRKKDEIHPVAIEEREDGSYRVDMGVNFAGWMEMKVTGNPGDRIDFIWSEREYLEMTFRNYSAYIIGPSGEGTFRHRFNYDSGRWITVKGLKEKPALSDFRGWVVSTDYPRTTVFECSDELQNWIYDRVLWNFVNLTLGGYIVDCPQRERLGYGDSPHTSADTGMFNYALGSFFNKWMGDWRDVQGGGTNMGPRVGGGALPHTAPTYDGGGGPSWGGCVVTLPWLMYQHYSDTRVLEENFELISKWLDFLDTHTRDGILERWGGRWDFLADWLWPGATAQGMNNDKPEAECYNSSYLAFNLATAAKIANVLGRATEAAEWNRRADATRRAVHKKYFNAGDNSYCDRSMGNLGLALIGEVPPPELRNAVWKRLEEEILVNCGGHIDVGIGGGGILFMLLRGEGRDDLIYSMTSQTDYPGWGCMREHGATSLWEMWEPDLPKHSLLHSSYLYPGAWYIDGVAGIRRDPECPGMQRFIVRSPMLSEDQMQWAKASFDSPAGTIVSSWKKENGLLTHEITVPANTSATVMIPENPAATVAEDSGYAKPAGNRGGYLLFEVLAGKYIFKETAR